MLLSGQNILISGVAGFIGAHLCKNIIRFYPDVNVIGIDNLNDYYDVNLKYHRLSWFEDCHNFVFQKGDIADKKFLNEIFEKHQPEICKSRGREGA